jgi:hypothetical protein
MRNYTGFTLAGAIAFAGQSALLIAAPGCAAITGTGTVPGTVSGSPEELR